MLKNKNDRGWGKVLQRSLKTIWVGVNKDGSLFRYEKKTAKPKPGTAEKPEYEIKPKAEA